MHILICDDDAAFGTRMAEYVAAYFAARSILVQTAVCTSAGQALETPELELYQLAFLDVDMPGVNGMVLGRQINVYGDIPRQPICTYYGKIADLPQMLYENGFLQVSRSDVVNMKYVCGIRSYKMTLKNGVELSISRPGYAAIRSAYLEWKGQYVDE